MSTNKSTMRLGATFPGEHDAGFDVWVEPLLESAGKAESRGSWKLVLSYPSGLPATMEGWRARVMVPARSFGVCSLGVENRG